MPGGHCRRICTCRQCTSSGSRILYSDSARYRHYERYGSEANVESELAAPVAAEISPQEQTSVEGEVDIGALAKDLILLVTNHGVSWAAMSHVMTVINEHLSGKSVYESLPKNEYQIKVAAGIAGRGSGGTRLLATCSKCDFVFDDESMTECPKCKVTVLARGQRKMIVGDVSNRLHQLYAIKYMAQQFEYCLTRKPGDGDCWDGTAMSDITDGN